MKKFIETLNKNLLSEEASDYLSQCDQGALIDLFGDCETLEEVEETVKELKNI